MDFSEQNILPGWIQPSGHQLSHIFNLVIGILRFLNDLRHVFFENNALLALDRRHVDQCFFGASLEFCLFFVKSRGHLFELIKGRRGLIQRKGVFWREIVIFWVYVIFVKLIFRGLFRVPSFHNFRTAHQANHPEMGIIPEKLLPGIRIPQLRFFISQFLQPLAPQILLQILSTIFHKFPNLHVKWLNRIAPEPPSWLAKFALVLIRDFLF